MSIKFWHHDCCKVNLLQLASYFSVRHQSSTQQLYTCIYNVQELLVLLVHSFCQCFQAMQFSLPNIMCFSLMCQSFMPTSLLRPDLTKPVLSPRKFCTNFQSFSEHYILTQISSCSYAENPKEFTEFVQHTQNKQWLPLYMIRLVLSDLVTNFHATQ